MIRHFLIAAVAITTVQCVSAENHEPQTYTHPTPYEVSRLDAPKGRKVKNVILMIGDGMSLAHVQCAWTCNRGKLWLENSTAIGLSETPVANRLIADSGAGGTAMAIGHTTLYHSVGVDSTGTPRPSLINLAHDKGMKTAVAVTCRLWDATPCDFLAHHIDRDQEQNLVGQFPSSPVDYVFGGGASMFRPENRDDRRDIFSELKTKGYNVIGSYDDFLLYSGGKAWCVPFEKDTPVPQQRKDMLARASMKAISLMENSPKGFFMMIEGSQLDDYGHTNEIGMLMEETLDFDQTVGEIYKWAAQDGETLVIVTADHETGGLTLIGGDKATGTVEARFSTGDHSGVMVPVYAFGPQAQQFTGFMLQRDIFWKIKSILGI